MLFHKMSTKEEFSFHHAEVSETRRRSGINSRNWALLLAWLATSYMSLGKFLYPWKLQFLRLQNENENCLFQTSQKE